MRRHKQKTSAFRYFYRLGCRHMDMDRNQRLNLVSWARMMMWMKFYGLEPETFNRLAFLNGYCSQS